MMPSCAEGILSVFRSLTCCGRSPDRATTGTVGDRPQLPPGLLKRSHGGVLWVREWVYH